MKLQMVGCSHHNSSLDSARAAGVQSGAGGRGAGSLAAAISGHRGRAALHLQSRRDLHRLGHRRGRAEPSASRRVSRRVSRLRSRRDLRRPVRAIGRGGGAAPVHRGRQSRQHGARRAADSGPGEAGLSACPAAREHRAADARDVSSRPARRQAGGQRDLALSQAGEHRQRGGRRFRPRHLRSLRRQASARDRRGRDGRRGAALSARRRSAAAHDRQPQPRAGRRDGRAVRRPGRGMGAARRTARRRRSGRQHRPARPSRS